MGVLNVSYLCALVRRSLQVLCVSLQVLQVSLCRCGASCCLRWRKLSGDSVSTSQRHPSWLCENFLHLKETENVSHSVSIAV